jgi:hypothetical protein
MWLMNIVCEWILHFILLSINSLGVTLQFDPLPGELGNFLASAETNQELWQGCHEGTVIWNHVYLNRLVDSPGYDRCKQASEMASHVLHDCEALVELRFGHLFVIYWNQVTLSTYLSGRCCTVFKVWGLLNA